MLDELAVRQVLGRYVRAHDSRDGAAMAALFTADAQVEILYSNRGEMESLGGIEGREAIAAAVAAMMKPHPDRGWSQNLLSGVLVEIDDDRATVDAQFMVFDIVGDSKPDGGWPADALGAQGRITPIESGYYRPSLVRLDGRWLIQSLRIVHHLPMAF
ncbi:MAG: nuclear transport factor 2 family protein [Pseudomonadota bacterium]